LVLTDTRHASFLPHAALFVMQTGNEPVWKPQGPRAVLIAMLILMVPCVVVNILDKAVKMTIPFDVVYIYFAAMVVATAWLLYSFRMAALHWCAWPHSITVTKACVVLCATPRGCSVVWVAQRGAVWCGVVW
jgi:hypothetical protein